MKSLVYKVVMIIGAAMFAGLAGGTGFAQVPANDECAGAASIGPLPYHTAQNTRLATPNPGDRSLPCADSGRGKTVWYRYTADIDRVVVFTSYFSTPGDYDVAFGLYTGSCGSLTEVACNDDIAQGQVRQAEFTVHVQAGVTYTLQVAEWNGGGPTGGTPTGGDLVLDVYDSTAPPPAFNFPLYAGPKLGSVASGMVMSTNGFEIPPVAAHLPVEEIEKEEAAENEQQVLLPTPSDVMPPKGPPGSNLIKERRGNGVLTPVSRPVVLNSFQGNVPTGFIPPDPIMAVGPNHVIGVVNSTFRIWDKNGTLLKNISLTTWFSGVKSPAGFSDPQVLYDHFAHRWIIAGGGFSTPYAFLISVSDDDNPLGTWYNYALPAGLGDSLTGNLPDYPQMGIDDTAIYITSREFGTSTFFSRVRIIAKAQLYSNTAGPVAWKDFWDFREPQHRAVVLDGIRPSIIFGHPGVHYMMNASPYITGTFFTVWKITDPLGTTSISGVNIPVVEYTSAPNANQLGGSSTLIEAGGSSIRHKPVYRNGSLWAAHSVASGAGGVYSAVHYVRINPAGNTNLEDVAMGADGFWHFYTALMVDANDNVFVTYTRSGLTEYPGAFISGHKNTDPPGLSPSVTVKIGLGNYVVVGNGRNRWGDYNGIGLDPEDSNLVWVNTEYASTGSDWGTWIAKTKMAPVPGRFMFTEPTALSFPIREAGTVGDTMSFTISSFGLDSLTLTSITPPDSNFKIVNAPSLPVTLGVFDEAVVKVVFSPKLHGNLGSSIVVAGTDPSNPAVTISLGGKGFIVTPAQAGALYASTGSVPPFGRLLALNYITGEATVYGRSGYDEIISLRVHPSTGEIIGLATQGAHYALVRINSLFGDGHPYSPSSIPALTFMKGMAYHGDSLYVGRINGALYRMNPVTGISTQVASTGIHISGLDFNPITGKLWATTCPFSECGSDNNNIYKINLPAGTTTLVGNAGLSTPLLDIAFDANGHLFGIVATAPNSSLAIIDTTTGKATIIGSLGTKDAKALAFTPGTSVAAHSFHFDSSWNLVSMPITVGDYSKDALFPSAASKAFAFAGRYIETDNLANGSGFWLKYNVATAVSFVGSPREHDTVNVSKLWNLIGSVSNAIPAAQVGSLPPGMIVSNFYAYENGGYVPDAFIRPGLGYWVKSSGNGKLVINAAGNEPAMPTGLFDPTSSPNYSTMRLADTRGNAQTLFIGHDETAARDIDRFELPPVAPEARFDVRYASNRIMVIHPPRPLQAIDYLIRINSDAPSMKVSWNIVHEPYVKYTLVKTDDESGKLTAAPMTGEGSSNVSAHEFANLRIRVEQTQVPKEFALLQNYPNPFNPTTRIRYELPSTERVELIVYDLLGRDVVTLIDGMQEPGYYEIPFSAERLSSGVYFYRLSAGKFHQAQKMVVVK